LLRHSVRLPNACCSSSTFIQSTILSRAPKNHVLHKTQKTTTTTTTTCSSSSCSGTNVEFLLQSFSTAPELQKSHLTSPSKKKQKRKKFSFFLSLSLSLSLLMRLAQARRAENKQRAESDKE
jgi:hypothetical protein